jgi:1,4-dihydroxy-2-naphthoate octaprenyltransferase
MSINFGMWKTALWQLVKMEKKEEWNRLDPISKWFIATRSAVTTVTLYVAVIAGLLAWRDGNFSFLPWLIISLGLFIAHGANNLLNDYTDFNRGIDQDNYFRTQYGVHPLVQDLWSKSTQVRWFIITGILAFLSGVFALFYSGFSPVIAGLFVFGALILLLYTYPLKHIALGELLIFLIWGPIMVAGIYLVLAKGWTPNVWMVALAGVPYGLSVASINVGKHTDKLKQDRQKGVHTLPVVIGEKAARYLTIAMIGLAYGVILYLIFGARLFTPVMLLVFLAAKRAFITIAVLSKPRPEQAPPNWPGWPTWYSGFCFYHNRLFGNLFVLGLLADTLLRVFAPGFWH